VTVRHFHSTLFFWLKGLAYSTELTDNVDEWVLWIAQDLMKRQASSALSADSPSNVNP
jgi:hypothetical protein